MEVIRCGPKRRILSASSSCISTRTPISTIQSRVSQRRNKTTRRNVSSDSSIEALAAQNNEALAAQNNSNPLPPLSIMPTPILLRSLLITQILASPRLLNACMPLMQIMSSSQSLLMNPDKNPFLHTLMRNFFYNHFCAGENSKEVKQAVRDIRALGYKGVILGYAKEVKPGPADAVAGNGANAAVDPVIEAWRVDNLKTLEMIGDGDFLAIKLTGAGQSVISALESGSPIPSQLRDALHEICDSAAARNTLIWIDAEQQTYQATIDAWTIDLMRIYNKNNKIGIYNTFQTYLKSTPSNILHHLQLASAEGWGLGLKLVRGAYIATEPRQLIHDTKEDTDACFDSCTAALLSQQFPNFDATTPSDAKFPPVELFLATHNEASVKKASRIQRQRAIASQPLTPLGYGQLQGMADEVSYELLQMCQSNKNKNNGEKEQALQAALSPHAFKYLSWGSVQECMQYLLRRAVENKGAIERTKSWAAAFRRELWRRMISPVAGR